jgi:uncharacterized protein with PIN domain
LFVFLLREYPEAAVRRFLCDAMLGGLAKWLRAAGHDAYYAREGTDISDAHLVRVAMAEGRVLLTSDRGFLERKPVRNGEVGVAPVAAHAGGGAVAAGERDLRPRPPSVALHGVQRGAEAVGVGDVAEEIPPGAARSQDRFFRCKGCGRVFWHGSHWARIGARLERVFG